MKRKFKTYTSADWQRIYPSPVVRDPDGWDRSDFHNSWYRELIDNNEYWRRIANSTCQYPRGAWDVFNKRFAFVLMD